MPFKSCAWQIQIQVPIFWVLLILDMVVGHEEYID